MWRASLVALVFTALLICFSGRRRTKVNTITESSNRILRLLRAPGSTRRFYSGLSGLRRLLKNNLLVSNIKQKDFPTCGPGLKLRTQTPDTESAYVSQKDTQLSLVFTSPNTPISLSATLSSLDLKCFLQIMARLVLSFRHQRNPSNPVQAPRQRRHHGNQRWHHLLLIPNFNIYFSLIR